MSHPADVWPKYRVSCQFQMKKSTGHFPAQFPVLLDLNIPYPINFSGHCKNCTGGKRLKFQLSSVIQGYQSLSPRSG